MIVHLASRCAKDDRAKLTPQWWGQMDMRLVSLSVSHLSPSEQIHLLRGPAQLWNRNTSSHKKIPFLINNSVLRDWV